MHEKIYRESPMICESSEDGKPILIFKKRTKYKTSLDGYFYGSDRIVDTEICRAFFREKRGNHRVFEIDRTLKPGDHNFVTPMAGGDIVFEKGAFTK